MNLPIDGRDGPFRPKYIEDETPMLRKWIVLGSYDDGTVCVTDGTDDIFIGLHPLQADIIVKLRNTFIDGVLLMLNKGE